MKYQLGFLGAGNMAEAIAKAALDAKIFKPTEMIASDPVAARREVFEKLGIATVDDNHAVIRDSRQILLAVKPQTLPALAEPLRSFDTQQQILISIMAGIRIERMQALFTAPARIVRVMPNTPLMVGQGMAGVAMGPHTQAGDELLTLKLFSAAGQAIIVPEAQLDAITAVSGSGPAYVFYLAQAMQQAAREMGLDQYAATLVTQTIVGAAKLMQESADSPEELRRKVTSPGGTTAAAITHLEQQHWLDIMRQAMHAAQERSRELGK